MSRNRALGIVLALAILAGGGAVVTLLSLRTTNQPSVDTWLGRQIMGTVSGYLEPRIDFASLTYTAPYLVELRGVTLTARDGTRVTDAGLLTVELAETPEIGSPIHIRKIVLDAAAVNFIESPSGGFKGLVPFVRAAPGKESEKTVDESLRLSTVLRLEKVEIRNCSLTYTPADGSPPMALGGLSLDLNVAKVPRPEPGWYGVDTSFGRLPQLTVTAKGAVNLDTLLVEVEKADLQIELNESTMQGLPPQVQAFLQRYDARGRLTVSLSGRVPVLKALEGDLACSIGLGSFRVSSGEYTLPIDKGQAALGLKAGTVTLENLRLEMLGGTVRASGAAHLTAPRRPADLAWQVDSVDLKEVLRGGTPAGQPPKIAGILGGSGTVAARLDDPRASLTGDGQVHVRDGRLVVLPGLKELAETMRIASGSFGSPELNHTADARFTLGFSGITVTESTVGTEFISARGTGLVGFDKTLDLRINAGPLEKLESLLGQAGRIIGTLTDKAVTYRVRGTFDQPTVEILPLGIE